MAATCGVIWVRAKIVCDSSTGGFVLAGRTNWMPRKTTIRTTAIHFKTRSIFFMFAVFAVDVYAFETPSRFEFNL